MSNLVPVPPTTANAPGARRLVGRAIRWGRAKLADSPRKRGSDSSSTTSTVNPTTATPVRAAIARRPGEAGEHAIPTSESRERLRAASRRLSAAAAVQARHTPDRLRHVRSGLAELLSGRRERRRLRVRVRGMASLRGLRDGRRAAWRAWAAAAAPRAILRYAERGWALRETVGALRRWADEAQLNSTRVAQDGQAAADEVRESRPRRRTAPGPVRGPGGAGDGVGRGPAPEGWYYDAEGGLVRAGGSDQDGEGSSASAAEARASHSPRRDARSTLQRGSTQLNSTQLAGSSQRDSIGPKRADGTRSPHPKEGSPIDERSPAREVHSARDEGRSPHRSKPPLSLSVSSAGSVGRASASAGAGFGVGQQYAPSTRGVFAFAPASAFSPCPRARL